MTRLIIQPLESPASGQIKYWDFYAYDDLLFQEHPPYQSEINSTLEHFRNNNYDAAGYEKLAFSDFHSLRTNEKRRLFFVTTEEKINNKTVRVAFIFDFHLKHKHASYAPLKIDSQSGKA